MRVDGRPIRDDKGTKTFSDSEKTIVHNIFILDCSGSMWKQKYLVALKGINDEIKELANNQHVKFTQSLVEFGSRNLIHFTKWMETNNATVEERMHSLGQTALNSAVFLTLEKILNEKKKEDRVLLKIFTDGEENDSVHSAFSVKQLISIAEKNNVTVTFVGTERDTKMAIQAYNLSAENTLTHDNTIESLERMAKTRSFATELYSKSVADGMEVSASFYSKSVIENSENK